MIIFTIFWGFLMFYQIFLSPQAKWYAIITYRHGIYELSLELHNDLRHRISGNWEISKKCLNFIEWQTNVQSFCQNENFVNTSETFLKNRNKTFPVVPYFTWKLELVSNILWMIISGNLFLILIHPRPLQT